jgi:hypothetical protein
VGAVDEQPSSSASSTISLPGTSIQPIINPQPELLDEAEMRIILNDFGSICAPIA